MLKPGKKHNPFYQAQAILARRGHAEAEVRRKLARQGFTSKQVDETIAWLHEKKLINDGEFVRQYIAGTLAMKPVGPSWLRAKLRAKGVSSDVIDTALTEVFAQTNEVALAQAAINIWNRSHPERAGDSAALWRFLASRGFSADSISEVLAGV